MAAYGTHRVHGPIGRTGPSRRSAGAGRRAAGGRARSPTRRPGSRLTTDHDGVPLAFFLGGGPRASCFLGGGPMASCSIKSFSNNARPFVRMDMYLELQTSVGFSFKLFSHALMLRFFVWIRILRYNLHFLKLCQSFSSGGSSWNGSMVFLPHTCKAQSCYEPRSAII